MSKSLFFILVVAIMLATTSTMVHSKDLPKVVRKLQSAVPVAIPVAIPVVVPVAAPVVVPVAVPVVSKGSKGGKAPKLAKAPSTTTTALIQPKLSKKAISTGFRGIRLRAGN